MTLQTGETFATTPEAYIDALAEPRRSEVRRTDQLIREAAPQLEPNMAAGTCGYGTYRSRDGRGREGDWPLMALSSRKSYISLYVSAVLDGQYAAEKHRHELGKANGGKSCIRFKRLADIDTAVLRRVLREGAEAMAKGGFAA